VKISIIGAGSTYTPELIEGVGEGRLGTPLDELVLMDLDPARLEILGGLAKRMLDKAGWSGRLKLTTSRYATPAGTLINERGIEPDIELEALAARLDFGQPQLDAAVKAAQRELRQMWETRRRGDLPDTRTAETRRPRA